MSRFLGAIICCLLSANAALADVSPHLMLSASLGGEQQFFNASGYVSTQTGASFQLAAYMPTTAQFDFGIRAHFFTGVTDVSSVGSGADFIVRFFPLTFSRVPVFGAGGEVIEIQYKFMPYVASGLGLSFQSVQKDLLNKVLSILPNVPLLFGTLLPLNESTSIDLSVGGSFGRTLKGGGITIQEISAGFLAAVAVSF